MSSTDVCSYVARTKSWLIKSILSNYFKAAHINRDIYEHESLQDGVTFGRLKELSDLLYRAKEDLNLIYKRLKNPRKKVFENVAKCRPTESEQNFIYNIGLLFHKATVARELQYMLEYYESGDDLDYQEIKKSLHEYIIKLKLLFAKGTTLLSPFLHHFQDDVLIISYFYENQEEIERSIGVEIETIFKDFDGFFTEKTRLAVAGYFMSSGWAERSEKILGRALELNL